jgi:hypothetical protein
VLAEAEGVGDGVTAAGCWFWLQPVAERTPAAIATNAKIVVAFSFEDGDSDTGRLFVESVMLRVPIRNLRRSAGTPQIE